MSERAGTEDNLVVLMIIVCVIAAIALWAVQKFLPEAYTPARLIIGAVALIAILYALLRLVQSGIPGLP